MAVPDGTGGEEAAGGTRDLMVSQFFRRGKNGSVHDPLRQAIVDEVEELRRDHEAYMAAVARLNSREESRS